MDKLTDSEIIKDFTEKTELIGSMSSVYLDEDKGLKLYMAMSNILILINRLQAENNDLFYKLTGVMHSVDKWLDGDELKQDEVNRAATMREKTLQIVESLQTENKHYSHNVKEMTNSIRNYQKALEQVKAENERLKAETTNHKHHKGKHCFLNHTVLHIIVHISFHLVLHGVLEHIVH